MATGKEDVLQALMDAYFMEKGTREFYAQAAQKVSAAEAKQAFKELAEWEDRHMEYIGYLYRSMTEDRDVQGFEEFSRKSPAPLTEAGIPVKDLESSIERYTITDDMGAVALALEIEGKAYNLYWKLSRSAADTNARVVFRSMMEQETKHIDHLRSMMAKLSRAA
ncbi:MAG: ferritin family protein [Nitrospirota bacterium]